MSEGLLSLVAEIDLAAAPLSGDAFVSRPGVKRLLTPTLMGALV
ncbi:MAG: hypothetical protein ABSF49_20295 [Roseiarcus sp.]